MRWDEANRVTIRPTQLNPTVRLGATPVIDNKVEVWNDGSRSIFNVLVVVRGEGRKVIVHAAFTDMPSHTPVYPDLLWPELDSERRELLGSVTVEFQDVAGFRWTKDTTQRLIRLTTPTPGDQRSHPHASCVEARQEQGIANPPLLLPIGRFVKNSRFRRRC